MKRNIPSAMTPVAALLTLLAQTGCYSYPTPYGGGYGETAPYSGNYPRSGYGGYDQNGYGNRGDYDRNYRGHDHDGDDDDGEYRERSYDRNRPWQGNPSGGYYGR